ncbi:conjugal transfer protein TraB [Acidithiobacillus ferrooxidans]|uniref:conjugal transfer protein TraB n=1 Tax=Acidithiobacillus ferrooxidans TaxID=920 RepID=UPI001C0673BF|nr:conjugal transfer protein TraB [Acidithiobacillus ferrooxidans]MBU2862018.1 conjugal transfer protein TraB [Acidithiobacillus ferrooxidans]
MRNRLAPSVLLAAVCGFVWQYAYAGPILALALIPLVLFQRTRRSRFAVALAYYLAGSHGIPLAAAVFFGPGDHWLEGAALWLVSSALLASGWAFADKAWKAAAVMLLDALMPPMAFFDWISPLTASGVLFPDWGLFGVAALLVGISITPWLARKRALVLLPVLPIVWNLVYLSIPMHPQKGHLQGRIIQSMNLHMGPSTHSILENFNRLRSWVATADQHKKAKVLLLPETLLTWWPGNAHYIEQHVPHGQTWLVGASIPLKQPGMFADGIKAVTDHGSKRIFASVLPVPVSMWRPWHTPTGDSFGRMDYKAFWWQKPVVLDGKSLMAEICYDQLLPFSWLEVTLYRPDTVLLTSNVWWAKGTGAPQIQRASAWAWSRLSGSTDIEAENS